MKALITGGAGFIGSHLAERLLRDGQEVTVVDNLSTGSLKNIESFKKHPKFDFVEGDVRDADLIKPLVEKCDVTFHLAAAVGVKLIADRPVHTIETNIGGTEVVLDVTNKFGKKILIASSSEVYGKNEMVPFREDDDIVLGSTRMSRWSYACSKAIDEFLGLLADKIIEMTGSKSKKEFISYEKAYGRPIEDMMRRVPGLERIKETIGWEPKTNLSETLQIIIETFKQIK